MTPERQLQTATALVRTMMRSASIDKIRPIDWWARAKSALETAAASSGTFSQLVSVMGRKLQIDVAGADTAVDLAHLADEVGDDFDAFARYCASEALFVIAMAQAASRERKAEYEAQHGTREERAARKRSRTASTAEATPNDPDAVRRDGELF